MDMKDDIIKFLNTDNSKNNLKLLFYLSSQYGDAIVEQNFDIYQGCDTNYYYSPYAGAPIKDKLPTNLNVFLNDFFHKCFEFATDNIDYDCDNYNRIDCYLNLKEKKITFDISTTIIKTEDKYYEYNQDTLSESILSNLEDFKNDGYRKIRFDFNGSGDSGYIDSPGYSDDNNSVDLPASLEDFFYERLNNTQSGWEINEGSQGYFSVYPSENKIDLYFGLNYEDSVGESNVEVIDISDIKY
jgi:hypothetical protein